MKNKRRVRRVKALFLAAAMSVALIISLGTVAFLIIYILSKGLPHITLPLLTEKPSYLNGTVGILPDILNTLYIIAAVLVIVLPIGVGGAVYLSEYSEKRFMKRLIFYASDTLSGIPSVIYGLVGMLVFCRILGLGTSLSAGALTLSVMNLPTVIKSTSESLATVPASYREGAYGLGAGKWRVIRTVVLPSCADGIITGALLTVGRILGESAALLFTAGFAHSVNGFFSALFSSGATLSVALYVYAKERGDFETAFAVAAVLLILSILINFASHAVGHHIGKRRGI